MGGSGGGGARRENNNVQIMAGRRETASGGTSKKDRHKYYIKYCIRQLKADQGYYDAAVKLDKQAREDVKDAVLFSLRL